MDGNFGNFVSQSAVAREAGTGGPGQQPSNSDKRIAIIGSALLVIGLALLLFL